ncbi:DUF5719 family protein [Salinibacterium sp. SYSU T00001]|uniref:DUF5719 family protein n=1 Tax=Homoserinimonas sedimenticola TaxID=2986805 RepID=UPI002236ACF8|nr:DUF5719 family protein [Salinibacterium sedimenticola]MCW4385005.1 DUF5719 family protein [Salinibacterium sedimenticola]
MTDPQRSHEPQDDVGDIDLTYPATPAAPAETTPSGAARSPRTLKGAAIVSARVVTGLIGVAVAAVVLAATILLPLPTLSLEPPAVVVTPVAAQQARVCPGPLLRLGDDTGAQATTASALGEATITSGASDGDIAETPARDVDGGEDTGEIVALAGSDEDALLAASQSQSLSSGDFVGTAAAECLEPRDDTWLVGGATTTGRTSILTIVNPGEVAARVDITVYSDAGAVSAPGTSGIAIPAGEQRVFSLAGLAPGLSSPVVRVQSQGALVVATLQQSTVRTLEPGGLDFVTGPAEPSTELSIPGVILPDPEDIEDAISGEDYLDLNPAIRMFVPGEAQAHAVVTMVPVTEEGESVEETPVDISVTLDPGRVTELPVGGFEPGRYVASIASDVPIVAGVRVATVASDGDNDFVWLPATQPLDDTALLAVARGANPVLTLHNPGDEDADVVLTRGDAEAAVTVEAGSAVFVEVAQGGVYTLEGVDGMHASVGYLSAGTITAHSVSPRAPSSSPIVVYP